MKLKAQVLIFSLTLGLFSGSLIIGLTWKVVHSIITENVRQAGLARAEDLSDDNLEGYQQESETSLLPTLQLMQRTSGADYAAFLDQQGRVIAHTNVAEKSKIYSNRVIGRALQDNQPGAEMVDRDNKPFMVAWAPVWMNQVLESNEQFLLGGQTETPSRRRLGTVLISLPMSEAIHTRNDIIRNMTVIVVSIGCLALIFVWVLMRQVLKRIELLTEGTSRIAQGEYGTNVPVNSSDELGELANSFNRMSKVLAETTISKDFLGDILSHMIDPLIVLTTEGFIRMVNRATLDLLGYTKEELEGQRAHSLFVGKDQLSAKVEQETLIGKGSVRNLELNFLTKAGLKVPVLFSSSLLKDAEGHPNGIIAVAKDMTERKKLENAVRQSEKLSAVGQLAAGVAHEINNPLGVILGFAQAVVRRLKPNDPLELPLKSIEKEAVRCKNLVQDLLTFSRVSKIDREPVDINRAVEGAFSLVIAQARITHVEVRKELAPDLPRILGNFNQIQQVIINLANNAFDAMSDSAGTLTVKTESLVEDHLSWVCLKVTDSGSGVPDEIVSRIFDPFFTTKPVGKGTGLGLSLVHEIIKKHSGSIEVQSRPGHTEFCIKFPARPAGLPTAGAKVETR